MHIPPEELAKKIDHTNLKPYATERDILKTIQEAKKYNFRGVCIPPSYVSTARKALENSEVLVITVVSFPLGYTNTKAKINEAKIAAENGADEIDVVMNISAFKSKNYDYVLDELKQIVEAVSIPTKVIIETSYLEPDEIKKASEIIESAGAFCVKTNTGFGPRGVTVEDVRIIRSALSLSTRIKASGGIRTAEFAIELINNGADILGTSSGVKIFEEYKKIWKQI